MKNLLIGLAILSMVAISCEKETVVNQEVITQGRPLAPQTPIAPQVKMLHPTTTETVINGCIFIEYTKVFGDTLQFKFDAKQGQTWYGTPSKLTKYRIVSDNVILGEYPISGAVKFPLTIVVNVPSKSLYNTNFMSDTLTKKWHSVGVSVWQDDGKVGSQGTYYYKPVI